jgi:hypothetical protein
MKQKMFILGLIFLILSCGKDNDSSVQPPDNAETYWYCELDGKQVNLAIVTGLEDIETYINIESTVAPIGKGNSFFKLTSGLYKSVGNKTGYNLTKGTMVIQNGGYPTDEQFEEFMSDQNNAFSVNAVNGIEVSYYDEQAAFWSTSQGSQIGSNFKITKITPVMIFGDIYMTIEAQFNCSLYNATGSKIILSNGKAKLTFEYI